MNTNFDGAQQLEINFWEGIKFLSSAYEVEMQERSFHADRMPEYLMKAKAFAGEDHQLFERIQQILNNTDFQLDQQHYLEKWKRSLKKLDTNTPIAFGVITEPCQWIIKQDQAFDFFKAHFTPTTLEWDI
jgi:hypothetical protein